MNMFKNFILKSLKIDWKLKIGNWLLPTGRRAYVTEN